MFFCVNYIYKCPKPTITPKKITFTDENQLDVFLRRHGVNHNNWNGKKLKHLIDEFNDGESYLTVLKKPIKLINDTVLPEGTLLRVVTTSQIKITHPTDPTQYLIEAYQIKHEKVKRKGSLLTEKVKKEETAVEGLNRGMSEELGDYYRLVTNINPGPTREETNVSKSLQI